MATQNITFDHLGELLLGTYVFNWLGLGYKAALLDDVAALTGAEELWSEISADEVVSSGYTAGGEALAGKVLETLTGYTYVRADGPGWLGLTATVKYLVVYDPTSGKLVHYVDLDSGGAGLELTAQPLDITWSSSYLFRIAL